MVKSTYITFYVLFLVAGGVIATVHFNETVQSIGRFAAVTAFLTGWIWWIYVFTVRLRNAMFAAMVVTVATATSLLISIGSYYISGDGSLLSVRMCLAALLSWLVYHLLVSRMRKLNTELKPGMPFPDAQVFDATGQTVQLASLPGKKMFLFHRGKWCPFCVEQVTEFNEALDEYQAKGISLYSISADQPRHLPASNFKAFEDRDGNLGKTLGVFVNQGLPFGLQIFGFRSDQFEPLGVLVDENMKIIAAHKPKDNRNRSTPQWFLRFLS